MAKVKDINLLLTLFGLSGNSISGRKRLQKMVCILKYKNQIPFSFSFKPYFYGPYSEELSDIVELMKGAGLLDEETSSIAPGIVQYRYLLRSKGESMFRQSQKEMNPNLLHRMTRSLRELSNLSTPDLVILSKQQALEQIP